MKSVLFIIHDNRVDSIRRFLLLSDMLISMDIKSIFLCPAKNMPELVAKIAHELGVNNLPDCISTEVIGLYAPKQKINLDIEKITMENIFYDTDIHSRYSSGNRLGQLLNKLNINNKSLVDLHVEEELNGFVKKFVLADKILSEIKPSCVVYDTELPQIHRAFLDAAKRKKIHILSMQHGEGNAMPYSNLPVMSDYYIAYSFYNHEILRGMGVEEDKIFVTGVPDTDLICNYDKEVIKEELRQRYHIDFKKKMVLAALRPSHSSSYFEANIKLLNILQINLAGNSDLEIIVKLHPVDISSYIKEDYLNYYKSRYCNMKMIESDCTISKLYAVSDYCLTYSSSAIVEAILQNVPTIVIETNDVKWPDWNKFNVYTAVQINDIAMLFEQIKNGVFDENAKQFNNRREEFIRYFRYKFDDKATERIANVIHKICHKNMAKQEEVSRHDYSCEDLFRQGIQLLKEGDPSRALEHYNTVVISDAMLPGLNYARAVALTQLGKLEEAKDACKKELNIQPGNYDAMHFFERIEKAVNASNPAKSQQVNHSFGNNTQNCASCESGCCGVETGTCQKKEEEGHLVKSVDSEIKLTEIRKNLQNNIFEYTKRVSIELSNLCNYANIHKKCPLNLENEHIILSRKVVEKVIDSMARYNFEGVIAFHTYNEPMMDPRLFMFIQYAKHKCPKCEVTIMSNGYYFNQTMADELMEIGVDSISVTAYTPKERQRLEIIRSDVPYVIQRYELDDRLNLYDRVSPATTNMAPCYAPLNEIIVTRKGQVSLCCLDWKRKHCFGNLYNESLEDVILQSDVASVYTMLSDGHRGFAICKSCEWSR